MTSLPEYILGLLVLAAVLTCSACSLFEVETLRSIPLNRGFDDVELVNQTGEVLFYLALELETSHLVDPRPFFPPDDVPLPRLEPGTSAVVEEIDGYEKGDDVRFFLYTLKATDRGEGVAQFTTVLTVTHEALVEQGGRIVVRDL